MPDTAARVVLVRPHYAGNLGATARAMRNFGVSQLTLVAPIATPHDPEALRLATRGHSILAGARIVPTLAEAVADCRIAIATSALTAGIYRDQQHLTPRELLPALAAKSDSGPIALVFGPEPSGLTNAEVSRCHHLMHIPAAAEYPALNLGQAVAICLYEWNEAIRGSQVIPVRCVTSIQDQDRAFDHLREALEAVHFLYGPKSDSLMHAVRRLISRADPNHQELKILHGLARQLLWVSRQRDTPSPPES
jgi:tRNA/rRNA methyltransferase